MLITSGRCEGVDIFPKQGKAALNHGVELDVGSSSDGGLSLIRSREGIQGGDCIEALQSIFCSHR